MEQLEHLELTEQMEPMVRMELTVSMEQLEHLELMELTEQTEPMVRMELTELMEYPLIRNG
jgi:hypothetical protein